MLSCLYAFGGCVAFSLIFEMRRWNFILTAAGIGMVARAVCLLLSDLGDVWQVLLATIVTAALAEIFARILKTPATVLLIIGIVPLVPGGELYYTMEALVNGDLVLFAQHGRAAIAAAGAIAVGSSLVSAVTRLLVVWRRNRRQRALERRSK